MHFYLFLYSIFHFFFPKNLKNRKKKPFHKKNLQNNRHTRHTRHTRHSLIMHLFITLFHGAVIKSICIILTFISITSTGPVAPILCALEIICDSKAGSSMCLTRKRWVAKDKSKPCDPSSPSKRYSHLHLQLAIQLWTRHAPSGTQQSPFYHNILFHR